MYSSRMKKKQKNRVIMEAINEGVELAEEYGFVISQDERCIKHYKSSQKILLVGEGDFSFSAALTAAFGSASNMIATSLDSIDFLNKHYENAFSNIVSLRRRGCTVLHGVNARDMANHPFLQRFTFDRIVFNFPFARNLKKKSRTSMIRRQQALVSEFLENGREMIGKDGEIHITHKTNGLEREWDITDLAEQQGLELVRAVGFKVDDYPGYNTKRGYGGDANFNCYPSKTYMFRLSPYYWDYGNIGLTSLISTKFKYIETRNKL